MKYLVITQNSIGKKDATIFDSRREAEEYLKQIASLFEYPIKVNWETDNKFSAQITYSDTFYAYVAEMEKAEYRLVRHIPKEKDEERRFFKRENALKFVAEHNGNISEENNAAGEWPSEESGGSSYKLYTVVLKPDYSSKPISRFDSASATGCVSKELGIYIQPQIIEEEIEEDIKEEATVKEKANNVFEKPLSKKKRRLIPIIAACTTVILVIVGIVLANLDWQLIADENKASQYTISSEMESIADNLLLTRKGRAVLFASQPKFLDRYDFNRTCGKDGSDTFTSGCYYKDSSDDEHIDIFDIGKDTINENGVVFNFANYRRVVVHHEMLHAVWNRLPEDRQEETCNRLKVLSNQIYNLGVEVSSYNTNEICTELFARVGSEYIAILNNNKYDENKIGTISIDGIGEKAIAYLNDIYDDYFDTSYYSIAESYWNSKNSLTNLSNRISSYGVALNNKKNDTQNLINSYYSWPTRVRYNNANNSIAEYNNMVSTYNSYVSTLNSIYRRLDSEAFLNLGSNLYL